VDCENAFSENYEIALHHIHEQRSALFSSGAGYAAITSYRTTDRHIQSITPQLFGALKQANKI
jgi:hypothetical protein